MGDSYSEAALIAAGRDYYYVHVRLLSCCNPARIIEENNEGFQVEEHYGEYATI